MVSIYKNFKKAGADISIEEVIKRIKNGDYQEDIKAIRYALHKEDNTLADEIKSKLFAFTTSGTFGKSRIKEELVTYSKLICLDFDKLSHPEVEETLAKINQCKYTYVAFKSPSGMGIKVIVKVNSDINSHELVYEQVAEHYKSITGIDYDNKCKDITRLCFFSFDEDIFVNNDSETFVYVPTPIIEKPEYNPKVIHVNSENVLDKCLKFTEEREQYVIGNRNNFIHLFASNANRMGVPEHETLDFCISNFDLEVKEINSTVKSAYKRQDEFGKFAKFADLQNPKKNNLKLNQKEEDFEDEEDYMLNSPKIPSGVYKDLPPILKQGAEAFLLDREKDVFLTSAITILSGCLPNVSGVYGGRKVYPNLFCFIIAPAASGKGTMQSAKELADVYHTEVRANSEHLKKQYKKEMDAYKMRSRNSKPDQEIELEEPKEPNYKVVYIPANASNASIIRHLEQNEGHGIICETEADTMGQAFKNDWGSYSDLLRKAFHHEKISVTRKTDNQYLEINTPKLSVALSGTPGQIYNIIQSAEDGLFSRNIFYLFKTNPQWLDPSPKGNPLNLTEHFEHLSRVVYDMVNFFSNLETVIHLSDEQWKVLNETFEDYLSKINTFVSSDAQSIVKRLGLILYRICMIFTAIRKFTTKCYDKEVQCLDEDFDTALKLIKVYLAHNVLMFENLPKQEDSDEKPFKSGNNKMKFFNALPQKFKRAEAIEIGFKFNIKERTVGTILKSCIGKYLTQPEFGVYEKIT